MKAAGSEVGMAAQSCRVSVLGWSHSAKVNTENISTVLGKIPAAGRGVCPKHPHCSQGRGLLRNWRFLAVFVLFYFLFLTPFAPLPPVHEMLMQWRISVSLETRNCAHNFSVLPYKSQPQPLSSWDFQVQKFFQNWYLVWNLALLEAGCPWVGSQERRRWLGFVSCILELIEGFVIPKVPLAQTDRMGLFCALLLCTCVFLPWLCSVISNINIKYQ